MRWRESLIVSVSITLIYAWIAGIAVAYESSMGRFLLALALPPYAVLEGLIYWVGR